MNKISIHLLGLLLISTLVISCGESTEEDTSNTSEKKSQPVAPVLNYEGEVTFLNTDGETISSVEVAIADDPEERNQGLMNITDLPEESGMLFIFPDESPRSFWMANTPLSLDIIYVNADSSIVRIHHSTTPYSDQQLLSGEPAKYVVETNGGYCVNNDITEGMKIRF